MKSRTLEHRVRNVNERFGETVTVVEYSFDGYDEYNDAEWTTAETDVEAEITMVESATERVTAAGSKANVDMRIYVPDGTQVTAPDDVEAADEPARPSRFILTEPDGGDYRLVWARQGDGRIACEVTAE